MKIKKITFITYHNWKTKRHGGFHQFAEYTCQQGIDTLFFSFSRPYYIAFKKEERQNFEVLQLLIRGCRYNVGGNNLLNFTWPTMALPGFLRRYIPSKINKWLMCHSFIPFKAIVNKWLKGTDCFVFESCDAVFLADLIKKYFPIAQIVYRPSDPLVDFSNEKYEINAEKHLISLADKILLVNEESLSVYKEKYPELFVPNKYYVVSNGVSITNYLKKYDCPEVLKNGLTALYIGAFSVDWALMIQAAQQLPQITFVIITPHLLGHSLQEKIRRFSNLIYIPGIAPTEVPMWITNANIIIQPFCDEMCHFDKKCLGLTAKNYKAIAAKKPIVTYKIPMHLSKYGLITTDTYEDFINAVSENILKGDIEYNININDKDWERLCPLFLNIIENEES